MGTKLIFASFLVVGLSGCYDPGVYEREGERFQKELVSLHDEDMKLNTKFTDVLSDSPDFPGEVFAKEVLGDKDLPKDIDTAKKDEGANVVLSEYPQRGSMKSLKTKEMGPLEPYDPPKIETKDFDQGFHAQQLRDMEQRAQDNVMRNERRIQR